MKRIVLTAFLLMPVLAFSEPTATTNSEQPSEGVVVATLEEAWRAGGDDDEVFFGNIGTIKTDGAGVIHMLDSQLAEIHRIAPDGEHLGTICKEGDGPGEARRPNDMFILSDGTVGVLQQFPGRVILLHPDGTPAGEATFTTESGDKGQFTVNIRGIAQPNGMALAGIKMSFGAGGVSNQEYFLSQADANGLQTKSLLLKEHTINYSAFELDELAMDFVWSRMTQGIEGQVVFAPDRDTMEFVVYAADGSQVRTFGRPYTVGERTADESSNARKIIEAVGANYPTPPQKITISDNEAAVSSLFVTTDGRVWAQPGHRQQDLPEGTWTSFDVYDNEGNFTHVVALPGGFQEGQDAVYIMPDGRFVVVVGALDAFMNQQAVAGEDEEGEEVAPLEVICYDMSL
ncbi:MAG: hypothetical protein ACI9UK_000780 [Candidatus Krumholzibacteriia bacterium]|jgi:hypothetical protein